jgi:hypothetical protein
MAAYVFKIYPEGDDEVYRTIQVPSDLNFEDFHYGILDAFDIQPGEMASFYTADESFNKGLEITLMDMDVKEHEAVNLIMNQTPIEKLVNEDIRHFVFEYDFLFLKRFHLIIKKIIENPEESEAFLISSVGEFKDNTSQYTDLLLDDEGLDVDLTPKKKKDSWEDYFNDDEDDFNDGMEFDNIDDLDL